MIVFIKLLIKLVKLALAISLVFPAVYFRTPWLASLRGEAFGLVFILSLGLIVSEIAGWARNSSKRQVILSVLILAIASFSFSLAVTTEVKFQLTKQAILNREASQLETLGQHFIVGYRNLEEVKILVEKGAIAGVFITRRNIQNKTPDEIQQEIQSLQAIRANQGLSPLWIATDQEGGIVSRLSPPLTKLPPLSSIIEKDIDSAKEDVIRYASIQGKELSEIGINLNFAPVVDLNYGVISSEDKYSKIYLRAISADKDIVAKVALWYCQTLADYGVTCTIKHFPGLGRVDTDTHLEDAQLKTSVAELTQADWMPFREVMSKTNAFTMLGHAQLIAVDPDHPVSFSQQVVTDIIRDKWQHNGILITDDFSMHAVYSSQDGLEAATVKAINAGVDLILMAYDTDLYYNAMNALLQAESANRLDITVLKRSNTRLKQAIRKIL
ncbi:MAG: glycoside hydrolase family 3 N-terminal domain-containing protein [Coleofasciculus sp. B1-GNL1-01]|uniref:glycoside hydrolase family 3 N-terminal domain-containing protein n=1 Tax=Coleofasciculus sp. B1-GNL1-01 TaxID=3068484 RepID=UPI0032F6068B